MPTERRYRLERVRYIPRILEPGILYAAEALGAAAHLCPCGCGEKVRTPLGPTDWRLIESSTGPSLYPSIGNWQFPCRSHYWIWSGEVKWAESWTDAEIAAGRAREQRLTEQYFAARAERPCAPPPMDGSRHAPRGELLSAVVRALRQALRVLREWFRDRGS